ncbi:MAG: hypothetical protein AAF282_20045 [Cyanobacteria bacterium P01_A01_bin.15]
MSIQQWANVSPIYPRFLTAAQMPDVPHLTGKALRFSAAAFPVFGDDLQPVELDAGKSVDGCDRIFFPSAQFGNFILSTAKTFVVPVDRSGLSFKPFNFALLLVDNPLQLRYFIVHLIQRMLNLLGQIVFVST